MKKALYGTREASKLFQELIMKMWRDAGSYQVKIVACAIYHPEDDGMTAWHGDDFISEGTPEGLDRIDKILEETFGKACKKLGRVGPGADTCTVLPDVICGMCEYSCGCMVSWE